MNPVKLTLLGLMMPGALLTSAPGVAAQDINREITVERELLTVENEARRLPLVPEVTLPAVERVSLAPTQRAVAQPVPGAIGVLDPARWVDPGALQPSRGYVAAAIGAPAIDGSLSAGYRLLPTDATALAAWLQWNSLVYSRSGAWWRSHAGAVGVDVSHRFGSSSLLEASAAWALDRFNLPLTGVPRWQTSNRADVGAAWHSRVATLRYNVAARYGWFGYANPSPRPGFTDMPALHQNRLTLNADAWLPTSDRAFAGVKIGLDLLGSNRHVRLTDAGLAARGGSTTGIVSVTPMWRLGNDRWTVALGPRVDFTINGGKAVHVAPDVTLGWHGSSFFAVDVRARGGERLFSAASLAQDAPRQVPWSVPAVAHMPLEVDGSITVGPLRGAWLCLYGGWAKANSWVMPSLAPAASGSGMCWTNTNLSGAWAGAEIGARVNRLLELTASYTTAPSSAGKALYRWIDRARHVVDARLTLRPVGRLELTATYTLRAGRAIYEASATPQRHRLANVSALNVDAQYALTPMFTVFLRGANLLNRNSPAVDLTPSQSANAMLGASLRF